MSSVISRLGVTKPWKQLSTGRWPDQIAFSPDKNVLLYSVNPNPQIAALDHVHVINYDATPTETPFSMVVQLPVMTNLPGGNRFYFFYVSHCNLNDTLSFAVTSLSGDTVNGIAGSVSFTLTGTKVLFVCVGINQNYIIHPINSQINIPNASNIPTVHFGHAASTPVNNPPFNTGTAGAAGVFQGPDGFQAESTIVAGMSGYIIPNVDIPTQAFQGFQCTVDGYYLVQPYLLTTVNYTAGVGGTNLGPYQANFLEFDSTGTYTAYYSSSSSYTPFTPKVSPTQTVIQWIYNSAFIQQMRAGNFYVPSFTWDNSSAGTINNVVMQGNVQFCYWAPFLSDSLVESPPDEILESPDPLAFRRMSAAPPALPAPPAPVNPNEIIMGSKQDTPGNRKSLHQKQASAVREARSQQQLQQRSSSSVHSGFPSLNTAQGNQITLGDLESIIRKVIQRGGGGGGGDGGGGAQQSAASPSSSSSSSTSNAAGKKRARESGEGPSDPRLAKK